MRLGKLLAALAFAGACAGSGSLYVTDDSPPPPREEVVSYQPGMFWVHGHWDRDGDRWAWRGGHYERERAGYSYSEGRWERYGGRYHWVDGGWRARGGVVIRENR